eukprot:TRINITY_DN5351_c0_g1_i1.p1 TRINITY_DN5351_c0_g1~~TRINITY_DN5351_c0_g1_i1.p1  ORF type:complete len:224 (+),score=59.79 TRINITY_DN5351_c0_g1_i1:254-925(+)
MDPACEVILEKILNRLDALQEDVRGLKLEAARAEREIIFPLRAVERHTAATRRGLENKWGANKQNISAAEEVQRNLATVSAECARASEASRVLFEEMEIERALQRGQFNHLHKLLVHLHCKFDGAALALADDADLGADPVPPPELGPEERPPQVHNNNNNNNKEENLGHTQKPTTASTGLVNAGPKGDGPSADNQLDGRAEMPKRKKKRTLPQGTPSSVIDLC